MDPDTCLRDALEALAAGDTDEAITSLENLIGWLKAGGFPPPKARIHALAPALLNCLKQAAALGRGEIERPVTQRQGWAAFEIDLNACLAMAGVSRSGETTNG